MLRRFEESSRLRSGSHESHDRGVSGDRCGNGTCGGGGVAATTRPVSAAEELTVHRSENRGLLWIVVGLATWRGLRLLRAEGSYANEGGAHLREARP